MAATSGSDASSLAPTDFKFSSSLEDSDCTISVAVEYCQLCSGTRRSFYCKKCVSKGDFFHSPGYVYDYGRRRYDVDVFPTTHPSSRRGGEEGFSAERYADKLKRWHALKKERLKLLERFERAMTKSREIEKKKCEFQFSQERVQLLRKAVESSRNNLTKEQTCLSKLKDSNEKRRTKKSLQSERHGRIIRYRQKAIELMDKSSETLKECNQKLYTIRRQHIADLLQFIFPISEIQPKSCDGDSMVMSTVSALAEARRTAYIRGRWVYTDNGGEHQYCIVEPTLPGNGDYTAYSLWLSENKDGVPNSETEPGQRNPAYTLSAALTYTSQLVSLLAYFLDVNLPKKMCYSEFCSQEKTEVQFERSVSRLNHNVLHLCFTQNVSPELIHPRHTIHNLLVMFESQNLGRGGAFEVNPDLMLSLDESHHSTTSDIDLSSSDNDMDQPDQDWDWVPPSLPEMELASIGGAVAGGGARIDTYTTSTVERLANPGGQDVNVAGGIMSSVASLWRAATSRMDTTK